MPHISLFLNSWLYWTDWGDTARIQRASMDGQTIETVHNQSTSVRRPQALTIDYDSQTLYWSDDSLNIILSSQVEPGSEIKNISSYNFNTSSMVIFGSSLYITDHYGVQSHSVNRTGYQYSVYVYPFQDTCKPLYGIDVISEQIQGQSELIDVCMCTNRTFPVVNSLCSSPHADILFAHLTIFTTFMHFSCCITLSYTNTPCLLPLHISHQILSHIPPVKSPCVVVCIFIPFPSVSST